MGELGWQWRRGAVIVGFFVDPILTISILVWIVYAVVSRLDTLVGDAKVTPHPVELFFVVPILLCGIGQTLIHFWATKRLIQSTKKWREARDATSMALFWRNVQATMSGLTLLLLLPIGFYLVLSKDTTAQFGGMIPFFQKIVAAHAIAIMLRILCICVVQKFIKELE
ncbi:unnamed protein product [Orchesella dallaii]|uniref:Uncharacterized protein n=1 Tax=Orchesella dallaii TaxID=48710 RepID=A0ABP1R1Z0_9HEXA